MLQLNQESMTRGFTLLEILVTISLLLMAFTAGLVAYQKAARNQALESDTAKIIQDLNTAKTNVKSGKKVFCISPKTLDSWEVVFLNDSFYLKEVCGDGTSENHPAYKLTSKNTLTNITIKFSPLSAGSNGGTITISPANRNIVVTTSGNIQ